ncbi:MAG: hypothetical protein AB7H77_04990 [Bdellovibrionales bacterium]
MKYKYEHNSPRRPLNDNEIRKIRNELIAQFQQSIPKDEMGKTPEISLTRIRWWNLDFSQFEIAKSIAKKVWDGAFVTYKNELNKTNFDVHEVTILNSEFLDLQDLEWISWGLNESVKNRKLLDSKNEEAEAT